MDLIPTKAKVWTLAARPKTLWAAVAPVLIGTVMAIDAGGFHGPSAVCALTAALLIQIGTNFSNDYVDFLKGADTGERKGPLRVTQAGLVAPRTMKRATFLVFALAFVTGLYLVLRGGWPVLAIGAASIVAGVLYTAGRYSLAYLGLGDLFVLLFFGPIAVGGTFYVQTLTLTWPVVLVGLAPGLLSMALLVVNNLRDVDEDRAARKKTLIVRFGKPFGAGLYIVSIVMAALITVGLYLATGTHAWAMLTLGILPLAAPAMQTVLQTNEASALNPILGQTAQLLLLYSVLFSVGWLL